MDPTRLHIELSFSWVSRHLTPHQHAVHNAHPSSPISPKTPRQSPTNLLHPPKNPRDQKPTTPNKSNRTQHRHTVQHNSHIHRRAILLRLIIRLALAATNIHLVQPSHIQHHRPKSKVAKHPSQDDGRAETLVVVFVLFLRGHDFLGCLVFGVEGQEFGFVLAVQILLISRDGDIDLPARLQRGRRQLLWFIIALCTPSDVVGVAEGVDVEDVDVGGREEQVL